MSLADASKAHQVEEFMKRFLYWEGGISAWEKTTWTDFIWQLSEIDFSAEGPYTIEFRVPKETALHGMGTLRFPVGSVREFRISPYLVEGWRALGLIGEDGRWDLSTQPEAVADAFKQRTGARLGFDEEPDLMTHPEFIRGILKGSAQVQEIHDLLFHYSFAASRLEAWRAIQLIAAFDVLLGIEAGEHSFLNGVLEGELGMGSLDYLFAPLQLMNNSLRWEFPNRGFDIEYYATKFTIESPAEYANIRARSAVGYKVHKRFDIQYQNEFQAWWVVLVRARAEINYRLAKDPDIPNREDLKRLDSQIELLILHLESVEEFRIVPGGASRSRARNRN